MRQELNENITIINGFFIPNKFSLLGFSVSVAENSSLCGGTLGGVNNNRDIDRLLKNVPPTSITSSTSLSAFVDSMEDN